MLPGLKERLLGLINDPAYTPLKKEELALIFDIHPTEMPMFYNFLEELEEDGYIGTFKRTDWIVWDTGYKSNYGHQTKRQIGIAARVCLLPEVIRGSGKYCYDKPSGIRVWSFIGISCIA